ncbi:uncharacterized protein MELLADRAFT_85081 [Melampsora larici-populina 98AG31]|uniref:Uncharacterized protein n=1 Tax=Melampsora larici-populina (strain 98AG31 / pathotype 3-4-7) TaxID=747676 RepID=F4RHJ7_MELLP|nr:uncharacterized protein MELLADRAFT_85081 [Melampsora larici-populina 98AG31]EGG08249.1 hypothetical protein MELLADRAFT_85081 [Melampsora larici-populina 98AG31]
MPPRRSNKPADGSTKQTDKNTLSSRRPPPRNTSPAPAAPPTRPNRGRGRGGVPRTNRRRPSLTASEKALDDVKPSPNEEEDDHKTSVQTSKRPRRREKSPEAPAERSDQALLRLSKRLRQSEQKHNSPDSPDSDSEEDSSQEEDEEETEPSDSDPDSEFDEPKIPITKVKKPVNKKSPAPVKPTKFDKPTNTSKDDPHRVTLQNYTQCDLDEAAIDELLADKDHKTSNRLPPDMQTELKNVQMQYRRTKKLFELMAHCSEKTVNEFFTNQV